MKKRRNRAGKPDALKLYREAIAQQAATAEILRVISRSPADLRPVFDAILKNALRLCDAHLGLCGICERGGYRTLAQRGGSREFEEWVFKRGVFKPDGGVARMIAERRPYHIADARQGVGYRAGRPNSVKFIDLGRVRTFLAVPLLKAKRVIGGITVYRREVRPFAPKQIALLRTFADHAVIAIENARLFNETKEALKHQAASAAILRSISGSMADPQPVFDAIVESLRGLFATPHAVVALIEGGEFRAKAISGNAKFIDRVRATYPWPVDRPGMLASEAIRSGEVVQLCPIIGNPRAPAKSAELAKALGYDAILIAPLLSRGKAIGFLVANRERAIPFDRKEVALIESFAAQAVIAIENTRLFNETKEALERQTATSEVLKTISRSTFDLNAVLQVLIENATRLAGASQGFIFRFDGQVARMAFSFNARPAYAALIEANPIPPGHGSLVGRTLLERRPVHIPDVLADKEFTWHEAQRLGGFRSMLGVPMMREGALIGVIAMWTTEVRPFTDKQIELVSTFADQAVIAIENVRLFNETKEALERQTATAEILKIMSGSPTDVQPVFDAIARCALRLFGVSHAGIALLDGDRILSKATAGSADPRGEFVIPLDRDSTAGRAILDRTVSNIGDTESPDAPGVARESGRVVGFRAIAAAPMLREGAAIGSVHMMRKTPGVFSAAQLELLKTFADQAVIAIENVRLFNETKEALEQQTAISEVLRVISDSPTDVKPALDAVVQRAARICDASDARIFLVDGDTLRIAASVGLVPQPGRPGLRVPLDGGTVTGRAVVGKTAVQVEDLRTVSTEDYPHMRQSSRVGHPTVLSVPLLREGRALGAITLRRAEARAFSDRQVALLRTFADQAAIAIENVRLFNETKEALERQTASAEILSVISSTPTHTQPVFDAIVQNTQRLIEGKAAVLILRRDPDFVLAGHSAQAIASLPPEVRSGTLDRDKNFPSRAILDGEIVHVPDWEEDDVPEFERKIGAAYGIGSGLLVPLLRQGQGIGAIGVMRETKGLFKPREISLLQSFADQAVIAIENVRLFREIEEKSAQLEVANKHKSEFLANMSHELRTPLNAIIGFSEVLTEKMFGEVNEKQLDYLKDIHESGKHLLSLINDILDLSKIEAGRMELELASFHLPTAISNAMTLVRERAQRHGIQLGLKVDKRLGEFHADERKVKQILVNLLSNAVKFTPDGGRVDIAAALNGKSVEIAVRDTGIGIAPEDQELLFEEFKQVGRDAGRKAEGTGLGLALTKKFVELHGGGIRVDSTPGKGSTFTVLLPLRA